MKRNCIALRTTEGTLYAALGDPYEAATQDWLEERIRVPFEYRLLHEKELGAYLARQEQQLRAMDGLQIATAQERSAWRDVHDVSIATIDDVDSSVIKLVTSTLYDALKTAASDIHLETAAAGSVIRYRIDGVLATVKTVEGVELADQIISRIKVMAELDIAERRVPQDGRFRVRYKDRDIDFRVSIMPNVHGEDAVLRVLDKRSLSDQLSGLTLEQLGFAGEIATSLRRLSCDPHGMVLVTGPTGSGKTTTLYAMISEVNKGVDKIITIEDPVEYQLPGVLQIPVNEKKGLTFARGLRSILRHDPDRIMVGEIRDPETAEIAVQSALTGHLVYTTVHANNVFDVIGRFLHMGVDTYNLASALNAVMAQRLLRKVCRSCLGKGCADCAGTGYRGRKAIAELLVLDDELKDVIAARAPMRTLKDIAGARGGRSLREAALELVRRSETTMEEIDRVTFVAR
jgi:general secretion pathway protein E